MLLVKGSSRVIPATGSNFHLEATTLRSELSGLGPCKQPLLSLRKVVFGNQSQSTDSFLLAELILSLVLVKQKLPESKLTKLEAK